MPTKKKPGRPRKVGRPKKSSKSKSKSKRKTKKSLLKYLQPDIKVKSKSKGAKTNKINPFAF